MKNRPLSPHLLIYRPQLTSMLSICHRLCGLSLAAGSVLAVWWLAALASSPQYFAFVSGLATGLIGQVILFGFSVAVLYHLCNGIRHLLWDFGIGLSLEGVYRSGYMVLAATVILTAALWGSVWGLWP